MRFLFFVFCLPFLLFAETHFLLIRHGETEWNVQDRLQGHADIPLNETGLEQARSLCQRITDLYPGIEVIYSSDLQRASATAQPLAQALGLPIHLSPSLREYHWGELDGFFVKEKNRLYSALEKDLEDRYPSRSERWNHTIYPGAETFRALCDRLLSQLVEIGEKYPDKEVAVFTHGRSIRTLISEILDIEIPDPSYIPNGAIVHITYSPENKEKPFSFERIETN